MAVRLLICYFLNRHVCENYDVGVSSNSEDDDDDEDNAPLMILEYMPYGDLQGFLESHKYVLVDLPIDVLPCITTTIILFNIVDQMRMDRHA